MDSTLVAPRTMTLVQTKARTEPSRQESASENFFDRKIPLGLACAFLAPAGLAVLLSGMLTILSMLNILPTQ